MDERTRVIIAETFPNFPEPLAEEWLAPFVAELGAPRFPGRWQYILAGRGIEFWKTACWTLERVDLVDVVTAKLNPATMRMLGEMEMAYFEGIRTPYSQITDGKERTLRALEYLKEHHVFPSPPALLYDSTGAEIMDGNHRILAFVLARRMHPPAACREQEVWVTQVPEVA